MKKEFDFAKTYPTAWKEGYKRGREKFNEGFNLRDISLKNRFKDFFQKMAFQIGVMDGWLSEQDDMNEYLS